jgi:hemolysin D
MNDVARSIAPAGPVATPTQRPQTGRALSLRDTWRGAESDREFLAPVLEILETPASPVRVAFLWTICALVVVGLAMAYFGRIDIIAAAQGKFHRPAASR